MVDLIWKDVTTLPKNGRVVIAKDKNHREFLCQFAPLPDGIGYYGYLELTGYPRNIVLKQCYPTHWRENV
jgi:hypothetical protein